MKPPRWLRPTLECLVRTRNGCNVGRLSQRGVCLSVRHVLSSFVYSRTRILTCLLKHPNENSRRHACPCCCTEFHLLIPFDQCFCRNSPLVPVNGFAIPRVRTVTGEQFVTDYVQRNQPCIIEQGLDTWIGSAAKHDAGVPTTSSTTDIWSLQRLHELLGDTPMQNVFASETGRFLYFKSASPVTASAIADSKSATIASVPSLHQTPALARLSMPFR